MKIKEPLRKGIKFKITAHTIGGTPYKVTYKVIKSYPHHVLCVDKKGTRQCFTNAELYQLGLVEPKNIEKWIIYNNRSIAIMESWQNRKEDKKKAEEEKYKKLKQWYETKSIDWKF